MRNYQENKSMAYTVDPNHELLNCSRCGIKIGRFLMVEGEEMIQIGGLVVSEIHGNCAQCGHEFHYSLNARRLEQLIRRVKIEPR